MGSRFAIRSQRKTSSRGADAAPGRDGELGEASLVECLPRRLENSTPLVAREQGRLASRSVNGEASDTRLGKEDSVLASRRQVNLLSLPGLKECERRDDDAWQGNMCREAGQLLDDAMTRQRRAR